VLCKNVYISAYNVCSGGCIETCSEPNQLSEANIIIDYQRL